MPIHQENLQLLTAQPHRVETGPVQFGDDWPGIFIRGDDALMGFSAQLNYLLQHLPPEASVSDHIARGAIRNLLELMQSCDARLFDRPGKPA